MHSGLSFLTGGQQRGIISPFGAMHAGSSLLARQPQGVLSLWGVMHADSSLLTGGQQRAKRYIMPFDAMHAGSSLLARQPRGILSLWGAMPAALISFDRLVRQRGIISPFGAMHAGSSLLTGGQQRGINCFRCYGRWLNSFDGGQQELFRPFGACSWLSLLTGVSKECYARWLISFGSSAKRYIMPFGAMHAGSSLLTRSQQRVSKEVYYAFRCYARWLIPDVLASFGASLMAWHRIDYYFAINGLKVEFELAATGDP
ncbi:hypothetical protein Tco_0038651 [Tanacetum coccineum]